MVLPLEPTDVRGVYQRGSKFVVVYRADGRQHKQAAESMADARAIKLQRDGEARARRRGPTLHEFSLAWLDRYAGTGHDSVRASTRREYRRLLVNFALRYFDREVRVRELDRVAVQRFVDWLTTRPGRDGLLDANPAGQVVLPRRRSGRAWSTRERRYLTRAELVRLLDEVPVKWRPLFDLLASTELRISEATRLRWSDLVLEGPTPHLHVKRAIVKGAIVAPKSRHGARLIPLTPELAAVLYAYRPRQAAEDAFVFPGRSGGASDQGSPRRRVLVPAAERAGLNGVGFHSAQPRPRSRQCVPQGPTRSCSASEFRLPTEAGVSASVPIGAARRPGQERRSWRPARSLAREGGRRVMSPVVAPSSGISSGGCCGTRGTGSTGKGTRMQAERPQGVPFRTQRPLGAVVNRPSLWSDR